MVEMRKVIGGAVGVAMAITPIRAQDINALKPYEQKPLTDKMKTILVQQPSVSAIDTTLQFTKEKDGFDGSFSLKGSASKTLMTLDAFSISQRIKLDKGAMATSLPVIGWFASEKDATSLNFEVLGFKQDSSGTLVLELESARDDSRIAHVALRNGQTLTDVQLSNHSKTDQYKNWRVSFENIQDDGNTVSFDLKLERISNLEGVFTLYSGSSSAELEIPFGTKRMSAGVEASEITDYLKLYTVPKIDINFAESVINDSTLNYNVIKLTLQNCLVLETTVGWDYPHAGIPYTDGYMGYTQIYNVSGWWNRWPGNLGWSPTRKFIFEVGGRKTSDSYRGNYELALLKNPKTGEEAYYQRQYPLAIGYQPLFIRMIIENHNIGQGDMFWQAQGYWNGEMSFDETIFRLQMNSDATASKLIGFDYKYDEKADKPLLKNLMKGKLVKNGMFIGFQQDSSIAPSTSFSDENNFLAEAKTADTAYVFDVDNRSLRHYYGVRWTNKAYELDTGTSVRDPSMRNRELIQAIFPNPNSGTLNLVLDGQGKQEWINLYDMNGKVVANLYNEVVDGRQTVQVDLSKYASGEYIIGTGGQSGKKRGYKLIVK